jgi:small subunit ribosomal protein S1
LDSLAHFLDTANQRYQNVHEIPFPLWPHEPALATDGTGETRGTPHFTPELAAAWQEATRIFQGGQVVSGIVTGWNRGGLLVRWTELQGFVPTSQLREVPTFEDEESRDEKLAHWVGEELALKVIELDQSRNRLVFSERATAWGPKDGERLLAELSPGDVRQGCVSNLCDFGVFVDLGGIDGLVHISELSWGRVSHPREILELGQAVQVHVISVDRENRRVALSIKRLRPDPWSVVAKKYTVGQVIEATITNVVDFGAFARIEDGLEGLIHLSELSELPVAHPAEAVHLGQFVQVRILRIDSANHRLGLSVRRASEPAHDGATALLEAAPSAAPRGEGE